MDVEQEVILHGVYVHREPVALLSVLQGASLDVFPVGMCNARYIALPGRST